LPLLTRVMKKLNQGCRLKLAAEIPGRGGVGAKINKESFAQQMPFTPHLPLFVQIVPLMPERPYSHDKA
jgi:hypothetical protein